MSIENNKSLVRRYFEEAPDNPEVYDAILAPGFRVTAIHHATINPEAEASGPEVFKAAAAWSKTVWRDGRITIDEMIAEGDRVIARWTFRGVQHGELFGISPTNKEIEYSGINIFQVTEGKLTQSWDIFDRLWLWQQLDVLPDTGEFLARARKSHNDKRPREQ